MNSFNELGVDTFLTEKLKERSIVKPTAIQNLVIPALLAGKSVVFRSATGTGKTFAYLLPLLQRLGALETGASQAPAIVICAPTLELCSQIKAEVDFLTGKGAEKSDTGAHGTGVKPEVQLQPQSLLLIGSVRLDKQIESLKKIRPAIVVGNPGRLLVLAKMGKLRLQNLRFLVMDEADRLTVQESFEETKEFLAIIERSISRSNNNNLCLVACSATVSEKTRAQLGPLFESAEIVESSDHEILRERIEHWALFSEKRRKVQSLRSLLSALKGKKSRVKALVFTSRSDEADKILSQLQYHSISAAGLFGKVNKKPMTSMERKAALDSFREGRVEALVSTDLAARGLDIPGITHVIALDVPSDGEVYIHRCGRTGRAGKRGIMITIGDETQLRLLASMEKRLKIRIQPKELYGGRVCVPEIEEDV